MTENESHKKILDKIATIHAKQKQSKETHTEHRKELADAIQEAKDAGITYREIGVILGIGKTGISSILTRSK